MMGAGGGSARTVRPMRSLFLALLAFPAVGALPFLLARVERHLDALIERERPPAA